MKNFKKITKNEKGFTLLEVMIVVVILAVLAAVAIPNLMKSAETARQRADITTGRELKMALDRFQLDTGKYPTLSTMTATADGGLSSPLVPAYINRLDGKVVQQKAADDSHNGFGIATIGDSASNLITVYLDSGGNRAEVVVCDSQLNLLWSSATDSLGP